MARIIIDEKGPRLELTEKEKDEMVEQTLEQAGGIENLFREMRDRAELRRQFEKDRPRLAKLYNNQWIAYSAGRVISHADTHEEVLEEIDARGIPRNSMITQYFADKPRPRVIDID